MVDVFNKTGVISILSSILAFTSPLIKTGKEFKECIDNPEYYLDPAPLLDDDGVCQGQACLPCNIIIKVMANWDDSVFQTISIDFSLISIVSALKLMAKEVEKEGFKEEDLDQEARKYLEENKKYLELLAPSSPAFLSLKVLYSFGKKLGHNIGIVIRIVKGIVGCITMPILISHFKEANGDQEKLARIFTVGGPIFQDFGVTVLTLLNYVILLLVLLVNKLPTTICLYINFISTVLSAIWGLSILVASLYFVYAKMGDRTGQIFFPWIMLARTFGVFCCNGGCYINCGAGFYAVANLWFAVQNVILATRG
ncbi:15420_t:CDS:1 [Acaulospora morrowiae]|uniref:15420_t:CDS:1 n=1 Tax=Acaulospora morrowiae TaxID=94023 RepID=A0A9N9EVM0_9GLOM|nr:15420_t:CDS:1 [Acaulospora morrowiae]